ncbi:MAG: hypothetical protein FJX77_13610, partial [Armatimonadetes bacterium]|nr:hypothetical protein [Armatimonadota bacterium]
MTIEKRPEPPSGLDAAVERIARVLEGECWGGGERRVQRVVIDSRQAGPGDLFVALPGERTNGHVFVQKALEQGAAGALVGRGWRPVPGCPLEGVICVPDPLLALGKLGAWRRNQFGGPVVGVTGSVGKTTTKDLLAAVLGRRGNVLKSTGNWNTEIGVPLTLLALNPSHGAAVIEMAMRGSGQIAYLAAMARPEIGVVTHIGSSHLELLGSRDAIAAAKAELLDYLPWQGTAVLPSHGPYGAFLRSRVPPGTGVIGFGDTRTDLLEPQVVGIPLGLSAPDDRSVPGQGWRTRFRAVE